MDSETYWKEREAEAQNHYIDDESLYLDHIEAIYDDMIEQCQREIDSFYRKYAKAEGMTMAEAKQKITATDIRAYERKAEKYVAEKNFSKQANDEMRLYNATMKINRLELLKANLGLELVSGHDELQKYYDKILTERTMQEFERQSGILGNSVISNEKTAHAIVNASYQNATFSDRIWMYQGMMKAELGSLLTQGLIQGKNPRKLAPELVKRFGVSKSDAVRLMRTELARVQIEAAKQSIERNGYEQYQFHALGTACDICKELDQKHFNVKDMTIAKNAPPMHPNCRCSISAYMDRAEFEQWLEDNGYADGEKESTIESENVTDSELSKLKSIMDKNSFEEFKKLINGNDNKDIARIYKKYGDSASSVNMSKKAYYQPSDNSLYVNYGRASAGKYSTIAHEFGHMFDANAKFNSLSWDEVKSINSYSKYGNKYLSEKASFSDMFLTAVRADRDLLKTLINDESKKALRANDKSCGVQDAVDGLLGERINWGHGDAYYNREYRFFKSVGVHKGLKSVYQSMGLDASNQGKVAMECRVYDSASEIWANVMSADTCGDESLEFVKKYLPNSYQAYREILKGAD